MSWLCQNWQGGRCYFRVSRRTRMLDAAFLRYLTIAHGNIIFFCYTLNRIIFAGSHGDLQAALGPTVKMA